ncbi:MAG: DUF4386 domain-containing protein [Alphaproteobacteria bacterium]|nr:DUF4386 domain-containing protein [Alphaproteobacteria bacterium]
MTNTTYAPSPLREARAAGGLYLIIIVCGVFSEAFVRAALVVPGDAAATAGNILASEGLFRVSFAADSIMALSDVGLAVLLYVLLKPVSQTLALMAMAFRLLQTAILGVNLLNHHAALLILNGAGTLSGFDPDQLNALALLSLDVQRHGYALGLLFFGVNSVLVGYLLFESGYMPRVLGVMMVGAGVVYLAGSYLQFLIPSLADGFVPAYIVPLLAETSLCLWLLVKGVDIPVWHQRIAPAPATA